MAAAVAVAVAVVVAAAAAEAVAVAVVAATVRLAAASKAALAVALAVAAAAAEAAAAVAARASSPAGEPQSEAARAAVGAPRSVLLPASAARRAVARGRTHGAPRWRGRRRSPPRMPRGSRPPTGRGGRGRAGAAPPMYVVGVGVTHYT